METLSLKELDEFSSFFLHHTKEILDKHCISMFSTAHNSPGTNSDLYSKTENLCIKTIAANLFTYFLIFFMFCYYVLVGKSVLKNKAPFLRVI